ncbi:MAG: hypothetical protein QOK15_3511 [Nocardioidaceae bacterium]|jgi:hypothetical protein|nr:hypothetical protein [Nocardioidaceae bacterium]
MDGMPEPPRRTPDDDNQSLEGTTRHLLATHEAALERGDTQRADQLQPIIETYEVLLAQHPTDT